MPGLLDIPLSLRKAANRLNPAIDLDVDILAVLRAAGASTREEWAGSIISQTGGHDSLVVDNEGNVVIAETGTKEIFKSGGTTADALTNKYHPKYPPNSNVNEQLWLDMWPDPSKFGPNGFVLASVDVVVGRFTSGQAFGLISQPGQGLQVTVSRFDPNWNREEIGFLVVSANELTVNGALLTIDFRARGHLIRVQTGRLFTRTGTGRQSSGAERVSDNFTVEGDKKISHLEVPQGFSIGFKFEGMFQQAAWLGMRSDAVFDITTYWRTAGAHSMGPYSPDADGNSPLSADLNPGYGYLETGGVPGYGAVNTLALTGGAPYGQWAQSRQVDKKDKPFASEEPGNFYLYHSVKAVTYGTGGNIKKIVDLGVVPDAANEVHFRADSAEPVGSSITFSLRGSNTNNGVDWVSLGGVADGAIIATHYRYYEVTATFTGTPDGLSTPTLRAISITERVRFSTQRYHGEIDSTTSIDPVTGQSSIGELRVPLYKFGRHDARDLATRIATEFSPSQVEAWVYVRETVTGRRHFLNTYRLENREPSLGQEDLTFVSGLDRLKVTIPQQQEVDQYPSDGSLATITSRVYNSTTKELTIGVENGTGTPFVGRNIVGWRFEGVTGVLESTDWFVAATPAPTAAGFTIVLQADGQVPAVGDKFRLHSDLTQRTEVSYAGQDFATSYADLLANQAAVPQRLRGNLPPVTGRTSQYHLTTDGRPAIEVIQENALHAGGSIAWKKGKIDYFDIYGPKNPVETWTERDYTNLVPAIGADRRMPSIDVKYNYDYGAGAFLNEVTYNDFNALAGWGRPNLFDVFQLPDDLCKWNDGAEAKHLTDKLLRAWSTGVRIWRVDHNRPRPWIEEGDGVTISTDIYTDREMNFSADLLTDRGIPLKGRLSAVGVVLGKNLWGTQFLVGILGLTNVTQVATTDGTIDPPPTGNATPAPEVLFRVAVSGNVEDVFLKVEGVDANFPIEADIFVNDPTGTAIVHHVFVAGGGLVQEIGPAQYAALDNIYIGFLSAGKRLFARVEDALGHIDWYFAFGDRNPIPQADVTTQDFQANPVIYINYDDDTAVVRVTDPSGGYKEWTGLSGSGQLAYTVGSTVRTSPTTTESLLGVDQITSPYTVAVGDGVSALRQVWSNVLHGRSSISPGGQPRLDVHNNNTLADIYFKVISPRELSTVYFKESEGAAPVIWHLCVSGSDATTRYVADGVEIGPADWFSDGTNFAHKLKDIPLVRDTVFRRYVQPVAQSSGTPGTWTPITIDLKGQPWIESIDLVFDESTDKLSMTIVGGARCQSAKVEISSVPNFSSYITGFPVTIALQDAALGNPPVVVLSSALTFAQRNATYYGRVTPYSDVSLGGIAGAPVQDTYFVLSQDTTGYLLRSGGTMTGKLDFDSAGSGRFVLPVGVDKWAT